MVQSFLCTGNSRSIKPQLKDKLFWKEAIYGIYFVKSCFDMLEGGRQHLVPVKMLWNPVVPSKVGFFFIWEVWWGKILTMNQLKKRGFPMASRCPFCLEHLLIHCPKIWCMWSTLFTLSRDCWVCSSLLDVGNLEGEE